MPPQQPEPDQYIAQIYYTNEAISFFHFPTRDVAAAFVGAFIALKALAGVRATLTDDSNGALVVSVNEPGVSIP